MELYLNNHNHKELLAEHHFSPEYVESKELVSSELSVLFKKDHRSVFRQLFKGSSLGGGSGGGAGGAGSHFHYKKHLNPDELLQQHSHHRHHHRRNLSGPYCSSSDGRRDFGTDADQSSVNLHELIPMSSLSPKEPSRILSTSTSEDAASFELSPAVSKLGEMAKPTVSTAGMLQVSSERLPPKETKREDEEDEETKMGQEEEETKELVVQPVAPSSLASVAAASTTSVVSSTPVKDEATISRLKKDVKILDSEILNLKNKRSRLSDWFVEQMTSPEYPEDDASLEFKVEQIKRRYKRRSDEIAQKLTAAEKQLSDTRMVMKHLQENCIPPDVDTRTYITQLLQNEKQRKDQQQLNFAFLPSPAPPYPPHPEDTDTSVSLTSSAPPPPPPTPLETANTTMTSDLHPPLADTPSSIAPRPDGNSVTSGVITSPSALALPALPPKPRSQTLPAPPRSINFPEGELPTSTPTKPTARTLPPNATNSAHVTRITTTTSGGGRSDSPSTSAFLEPMLPMPPAATLDAGKPSPGKKPRSSMRGALKHGLGNIFTKPFGRKSDVPRRGALQRSASEEHMSALSHSVVSPRKDEAVSRLTKSPSATNTRSVGSTVSHPTTSALSTASKSRKSQRQDNGSTADRHLYQSDAVAASAVKSSHAGSLSSGTTGGGGAGRDPKRPSRQGAAESVDTSGGSDPSCAPLINHQQTALAVSSILEVLYGGGIAGGGPRSAQGGGGVVTSSGGASSQHSGGNNPVSVGPAAASFSSPLLHSVASVGAGLATSASTVVGSPMALAFSSASQPPPAYNIAMALLLLHQRSQSLLEAQADTQQRITAELKEELSSMRQEITDTRNAVNQVSAEVDALRRDMRTKEDVQNQTLSNAVARLEQLDASAEKMRQHIQQDLLAIRNEQKRALEPLKYQLATETRDLRDMFTTLSNKVNILEKSDRLSGLDRDQPRHLRRIANTLTNLLISVFAFVTALIQILIKFLNAGATVTNNRVSAIVLNICLLVFLLLVFLADPLVRWWNGSSSAASTLPPTPPLPPR